MGLTKNKKKNKNSSDKNKNPVSKVQQEIEKERIAGKQEQTSAVRQLKKTLDVPRIEIPLDINPMLATLVNKPVDGDWLYEVKWDGFRALVYKDDKKTEIRSRNNKSFNEKYYPLFDFFKQWQKRVVLDGEIVVLNKQGFPDFSALQTWRSEADGKIVYFAFDLLWFDGLDMTKVPLSKRKKILKDIIPENEIIRLSETFDVSGDDFFSLIEKMGLEGLIAKKANSMYQPGARSKDWLKIKAQKKQETVIGGYTINENTSKKFSALLMGIFDNGEFVHTATVGTGFTNKMQDDIIKKLDALKIAECPFKEEPEYNKPSRFRPNPPRAEVTWVKPALVAEISFRTVASDGSFRHPSFKGLREDKNAKDVVRENTAPTPEIIDEDHIELKKKLITKTDPDDRKSLLNPSEETQTRKINNHDGLQAIWIFQYQ